MSVLIRGMEMPKKDSVMLWVLPNGIAYVMDDSGCQYKVIEIPTPHGRLADADALLERLQVTAIDPVPSWIRAEIIIAPTIIEAEEET